MAPDASLFPPERFDGQAMRQDPPAFPVTSVTFGVEDTDGGWFLLGLISRPFYTANRQ